MPPYEDPTSQELCHVVYHEPWVFGPAEPVPRDQRRCAACKQPGHEVVKALHLWHTGAQWSRETHAARMAFPQDVRDAYHAGKVGVPEKLTKEI